MIVDSGLNIVQRAERLSRTELFARAATGDVDALTCYVFSNGNIDAKDEDGMALMHYAACRGDLHLIEQLKNYGADLNISDEGQPRWRPLHYAIFHKRHEAEQLLSELGVKPPLPILRKIVLEKPQGSQRGRVFA